MNKVSACALLVFFTGLVTVFSATEKKTEHEEMKVVVVCENKEESFETPSVITEQEIIESKLNALYYINDKKEKLLSYKRILDEHPELIDGQEGIYESFPKEEVIKLQKVVEAEIGIGSFGAKVNVANAILNRFYGGGFGNTLSEVLNENQFSTVKSGAYNKVTVSSDTVLACEYCFLFEDTTDGAVYFESMSSNVHGDYAEFVFDDGYHKFYR